MGAVIRSEGQTIDYTPGSNVSSGDVVVLGNLVGVAAVDIDSGDQGALTVEGIVELPKASAEGELTQGTVVFWDDSADEVVSAGADAGNIYCGHVAKTAVASATVIDVKLDAHDE